MTVFVSGFHVNKMSLQGQVLLHFKPHPILVFMNKICVNQAQGKLHPVKGKESVTQAKKKVLQF